MMRTLVALSALALATSCAPVPRADGDAPQPVLADGCTATGLDDLIGRNRSEAVAAEVMKRSGARTLRWIAPGMAVTMDYRGDRLNIDIDAGGRITGFHCG